MRDYVPLGELEVGTVLHVQGGGEAILVSKTWRQGEFEVFDFEVEGLHNFYVRGEGSDAAGVLVHNSSVPGGPKLGTMVDVDAPGMSVVDGPPAGMTGPTAGKPVDSRTRQRILSRDQKADGSWDCATCGQNTKNPANVHTGHVNPRSNGGDLSDGNLRCEGAQCNLSQGDRAAPKTTCAEAGSCGAPYGRTD